MYVQPLQEVQGPGPYPYEKCCICLELKCGIKVLGILLFIECVFALLALVGYTILFIAMKNKDVIIPGWIFAPLVSALLTFWPAYYYFQYFKNDIVENRNNLVKAQLIMIFLNAWLQIWGSFGVLLTP